MGRSCSIPGAQRAAGCSSTFWVSQALHPTISVLLTPKNHFVKTTLPCLWMLNKEKDGDREIFCFLGFLGMCMSKLPPAASQLCSEPWSLQRRSLPTLGLFQRSCPVLGCSSCIPRYFPSPPPALPPVYLFPYLTEVMQQKSLADSDRGTNPVFLCLLLSQSL